MNAKDAPNQSPMRILTLRRYVHRGSDPHCTRASATTDSIMASTSEREGRFMILAPLWTQARPLTGSRSNGSSG